MALVAWMHSNPFDIRTAVLARHAQHVVLIHFPIALFVVGVAFDALAHWSKRRNFAEVAYYNFLVAAVAIVPTILTGVLAWQLQLEGQRIQGVLFQHIVLGTISSVFILLVWWSHFRARRHLRKPHVLRLLIETGAMLTLLAAAHLGAF